MMKLLYVHVGDYVIKSNLSASNALGAIAFETSYAIENDIEFYADAQTTWYWNPSPSIYHNFDLNLTTDALVLLSGGEQKLVGNGSTFVSTKSEKGELDFHLNFIEFIQDDDDNTEGSPAYKSSGKDFFCDLLTTWNGLLSDATFGLFLNHSSVVLADEELAKVKVPCWSMSLILVLIMVQCC
jgi:hypothetical protein